MFFRSIQGHAVGWALLTTATFGIALPSTAAGNDMLFHTDQLALSQLITQVLQRHPELQQRQADIEASAARVIQAGALEDPRLSYTMAPQTADLQGKDFGQKIMLSQKLPWPGKRELGARRWQQETEAKREQLRSSRLRLIKETADAYADWYLAHAAQLINNKSKALWREFQHLAELNYSAGRVGKQDVLKAEVGYYRLEHRDIQLQRQRQGARTRINKLLNRAAGATLPPPPDALTIQAMTGDLQALSDAALTRRPELQVLEHRLEAASTRLQRAKLEDYPDFNLNAGWNSLWDQDEKRWTVGLSINLPLDGGKRRAARDRARAERLRLRAEQDALRTQVAAEVQQAYDGLQETLHELALYRDRLLPTVHEALETSRTDYQSGSGDFLSLINAEKHLFQIELGALQAQVSAFRRQAELARSLGLDVQATVVNLTRSTTPRLFEGDQP